jgi:hypothetical protein
MAATKASLRAERVRHSSPQIRPTPGYWMIDVPNMYLQASKATSHVRRDPGGEDAGPLSTQERQMMVADKGGRTVFSVHFENKDYA